MILYNLYKNDALLKTAGFIMIIYVLTCEIPKIDPFKIEVQYTHENGTIMRQDYDMSTFYFEI
jgi:hypothetical protein